MSSIFGAKIQKNIEFMAQKLKKCLNLWLENSDSTESYVKIEFLDKNRSFRIVCRATENFRF